MAPCGWAHAGRRGGGGARPSPADFGWSGAAPPARDDGTARHAAGVAALGIPGLIDAHTHWFPDAVNAKIWAYFDRHYWPVAYRGPVEERLEWMRRNGASRFTTLAYAHRPGMAAWLNEFTARFAADTPAAVACGTFFPEPEAGPDVRRCIEEYRFRGFKLHLRVGDFDPSQAALAPAFEQIEAAGLPVVIHAGSAPDPGRFTAPVYLQRLLARHPRLKLVIAHMGSAEFGDYLRLAETYPGVHLDTTMVFVGFSACDPFPDALLGRLEGLSRKILFGSDFPTIPYPFSHAVEGILSLPLSDGAKRGILHGNAAALFRLE